MPNGITDSLNSERGVLVLLLVLASVVLVVLGRITGEQWLAYTQFLAGFLIAGKTLSGIVQMHTDARVATAGTAPAATTTVTTNVTTPESGT